MTDSASISHQPVMLQEVLAAFVALQPGHFLDATFGGGGHSRALLEAHPENTLCVLDCDPEAIERAQALALEYPGRVEVHHLNFADLEHLETAPWKGALFDFGVSSWHFDQTDRGFSFRHDAPLDMRLNPQAGIPASRFLESADSEELVAAVRNFGEEPRWRRVVEAIVAARGSGRLQRTLSFAELVEGALGGRKPWERIHPATRTFQGVRMAVNDELAAIERGLPAAFARLQPGGRIAAISFHSLEDRLVKRYFRRLAGKAEHQRDNRPEQLRSKQAVLLGSKPQQAGEAEVAANPRSRSAKLRIVEKLETAA